MSTENETPTQASETSAPLPPFSLTVVPYADKGDAKGFSYTTKDYNSIAAAVTDFGEKLVLDILNGDIARRIGLKARNKAGFLKLNELTGVARQTALTELSAKLVTQYPDKVIFTGDEASTWKPEVREITFNGIQAKLKEAVKVGNFTGPEGVIFWTGKLQEFVTRQQGLAEAGLS